MNLSLTRTLPSLIILCLALASCGSKTRKNAPKLLVFSKTAGYYHEAIDDGIIALEKLGEENNFTIDTTTNSEMFTDENLKKYSAVVFLNTTGDVFSHIQEIAMERYIQAGGGFVGIHAATDTEYGWNWYGKLVGAYFSSHPHIQEATFNIHDHESEATSFLQDSTWVRTDELYNFKELNPDVQVLLSVDESTYEGGTNGDNHPMAWQHEYDGGRSFYTAMGHTKESFSEELYLKHLLGGINYAVGKNLELDYSKVKSMSSIDPDRFNKVPLAMGKFYEPTEMTILPNKDVLIAQRRGELMHYNNETKELKEIAKLDVYHSTGIEGVNAEEGFMGLQKDPDYATNNWIYLFYAPTGDESVNRLSRMKYADGALDQSSEQVILDVASQRYICCHTGGSIAFDSDKNLYLSTGDNSTPFDEPDATYVNNGYAPLNDLPGKEQYDARRSSGNTNDLRGKILRIKVNEDGSYDIPEGNLFPPGTEKTRPEIYTMGHRNPYRISVDPKNGNLFWGDVGPDAREDNFNARGPRGYDEMNVATGPGNFGWPLFIADNKAYKEYNYADGTSGNAFDPESPINSSANNTGLQELPPAKGAYIYYDYNESAENSQLGSGGRNAMAGPAIYADLYKGENAPPPYYDGKIIIYEWMRGWMKAASFFPDGRFNKIEPFAPGIKLNNLIDMEITEDGTIYLLEYGTGWFSRNDDSGLSYIEYNGGNRSPNIENFSADHTAGKHPLEVNMEVLSSDKDGDEISYIWDLGNGETIETKEGKLSYTFQDPGEFLVRVKCVDSKGNTTVSNIIPIVSGNTRPVVNIELDGGNQSFYVPGSPINYKITVSDVEDGNALNPDNLYLSYDYIDGFDEAEIGQAGHQVVSDVALGRSLTQSMDCRSCHKEAEASAGPSYVESAEMYADRDDAVSYLSDKIINGSVGVWGEAAMPAHPALSPLEARQMATYVMSLVEKTDASKLPPEGVLAAEANSDDKTLLITATYTDNGSDNSIPLTGIKKVALKSNVVTFSAEMETEGFNHIKFSGTDVLILPNAGGWFLLENIDLTGIKKAGVTCGWQALPPVGLSFELVKNSPDGEVIGKGSVPAPKGGEGTMVVMTLDQAVNEKIDKLYFKFNPDEASKLPPGVFVRAVNVTFMAD